MPTFAICEAAYWATPNWAGKADEAARDAYYDGTYTSCAAWEGGRDGAAAGSTTETGEVVGPWTADDTAQLTFNGWDDTVTIVMKALGDGRHAGKYDASSGGPHRLVASLGNQVVNMIETLVTIDGLQVRNTVTGDASSTCMLMSPAGAGTISNCITVTVGDGNGINVNNASCTGNIWNTLCYKEGSAAAASEGINSINCSTLGIYNCTVHNFAIGVDVDAGTVTADNCAVFENGNDFNGTITITNCASDDGDGSNPQTLNAATDYVAEFTDLSSDDYSLASGGVCVDNGAADPGSGLYSDDIIGTSRPQGGSWDIGAFERISAGGANMPLFPLTGPLGDPIASGF